MTATAGQADVLADETVADIPPAVFAAATWRALVLSWVLQDLPYIVMLVLALIGVGFKLPAGYWAVLTPVFGIICVVAGWRRFSTSEERVQLVYTQALSWLALILAIYVLYANVVQGVLNTSATALAMMTLLALGTFTAGLQSRVWRICAVGMLLLGAVPAMGWLEQSAMFLALIFLLIIGAGFVTWWISQRIARRASLA